MVGGRQRPILCHPSTPQLLASVQLCHPSTPQLLASVQQSSRDDSVLPQQSRSLQKHQIFMLRKPRKASAKCLSRQQLCQNLESEKKMSPPLLGKYSPLCWRIGHSSQEGKRPRGLWEVASSEGAKGWPGSGLQEGLATLFEGS